VLLAYGTANSGDYMELRAPSAVVFTERDPEQTHSDQRVPYAPKIIGMSSTSEVITGVYLHGMNPGDVVISRGERKLTGRAAFYDFVAQKAVILEPVFRTIQEQRNIPVYIRGSRAEVLSPRDLKFKDAVVSTSDFATPTYSMNAGEVYVKDETIYDQEGEDLSERRLRASYKHGTMNLRGFPLFYSPGGELDLEEGHSALRKAGVGKFRHLGWGAETQWHLFRLLGLVKPDGVSAKLDANAYERGVVVGTDIEYEKEEGPRQYSGYSLIYGMYDDDQNDDFGDVRKNIDAPNPWRGRALVRHKEFLPRDWQIQGELSLLSDRNFLEQFYDDEYWAGKEQENLIYAKKQRDNWAVTALLKTRMNYFLTQTESYPDVAGYLIGQPLWDDRLTYSGEARMGAKRYHTYTSPRAGNTNSDVFARLDTLHELALPLQPMIFGAPVNVTPYVKGRLTYWGDSPGDRGGNGDQFRPYAQAGVRSNMHFWRVYPNVDSRLWDVHQLKHIITPEVLAFGSLTGGAEPHDLWPLEPGVEQHIYENHGVSFGLYQRLQTKRGPVGDQKTVDWMRFNVVLGMFAHDEPDLRGDGRMFLANPEYSLQRDFLNAEYTWNISDTTALLADLNYDLGDGQCDRVNVGFAVQRDPRLSYYLGMRYIKELDSAVGTAAMKYQINKKYSVQLQEQYDFTYRGGVNLGSRISIVRKFPRWYVSLTFLYDQRAEEGDDIGVILALWPEGVPEARFSSGRMELLNRSERN
jgi:hypothetical protein